MKNKNLDISIDQNLSIMDGKGFDLSKEIHEKIQQGFRIPFKKLPLHIHEINAIVKSIVLERLEDPTLEEKNYIKIRVSLNEESLRTGHLNLKISTKPLDPSI